MRTFSEMTVSDCPFNQPISDNIEANWFDHSRDLLYMVNYFRERMIRPIFGIGHSTGTAQLLARP
jgi:hypothetical protein